MLVISRFRQPPGEGSDALLELAAPALDALAGRPGLRSARVGRSTDDAGLWVLVTDWESVGAYRRALSSYEVKVHLTPLMLLAVDEPSAFEVLLEQGPEGARSYGSDLAADSLGRPQEGQTHRRQVPPTPSRME